MKHCLPFILHLVKWKTLLSNSQVRHGTSKRLNQGEDIESKATGDRLFAKCVHENTVEVPRVLFCVSEIHVICNT